MKYTNKIHISFIALCLFFLMNSCQKEFLDRKPLTATLDDLNQGGLEGQIFGIYSAVRDFDNGNGNGFGAIPWLAVHSFRDDDAIKGSSASDGADWGVFFDQFQYSKDHWSIEQYWNDHYGLIGLTNSAIFYADSNKLTDPASIINVAEAKFMRAHAYFDLVRAYGEVPKIDFRVLSLSQGQVAKSSVAQIFSFIDADLNYAVTNLPSDWNNASGASKYPGRLTNYAAKALLAKTKLFRGDFAGALPLLTSIINSGNYALTTNVADIFKVVNKNNKESIFEYQATVGANGTNKYPGRIAECQGVRGSGDWDLGWGWNTPTINLVSAFENGDPRKQSTILFSGQLDDYGKLVPDTPTLPRKYWNKKYYPEPSIIALTGDRHGLWSNQKIIRYADVLLMAAEAANEVGGTANQNLAVDYLEQVRARARTTAAAGSLPKINYANQIQLRTAIQNERRVELAMEGERFFDLVRWNLANTYLGNLGYQDKHKFLPIPQSAIDKSGGKLVQNPNY